MGADGEPDSRKFAGAVGCGGGVALGADGRGAGTAAARGAAAAIRAGAGGAGLATGGCGARPGNTSSQKCTAQLTGVAQARGAESAISARQAATAPAAPQHAPIARRRQARRARSLSNARG